jgi:hypothetical protein
MRLVSAAAIAAFFLTTSATLAEPPRRSLPPEFTAAQIRGSGGANLGSAQMYVTINSSGLVNPARSKGNAACPSDNCRYAAGGYAVYFTRDISQCAISATAIDLLRIVRTSPPIGNNVQVDTYNTSGTPADSDLQITVIC